VEKKKTSNIMSICLPYDIENIYAFMCTRYGNITYKELMNMGLDEFNAKLNSIPKSEPLYDIFKSRVVDINKIKDKEERKYWQELKQVNRIPDIYKTNKEINNEIKNMTKHNGGINNGKRFN
jgi:hypothetical protein